MHQLQSSYLLNELLGEFVFIGFCSHQTLMLSQHNPGTTATLSCLITRHTTWWLDRVGRDVSVGSPVRSTCQNHGWPAGWASSPPLSITPLCIPPLAPLVKWGHCPFCRSASEECGEQPTQHTHARAHTHIFWCTEWNFWRPFTRMVWVSCWMKVFCRMMTKILLWSSQLVLVHGQYECVYAVF